MVERVVDMKEKSYITYAVDEDSFGMGKMFADYTFRLSIGGSESGTRITIESFYTPRNPLYALMNRFMMKRQFSRVLDGLLEGLRVTPLRRREPSQPLGTDDGQQALDALAAMLPMGPAPRHQVNSKYGNFGVMGIQLKTATFCPETGLSVWHGTLSRCT